MQPLVRQKNVFTPRGSLVQGYAAVQRRAAVAYVHEPTWAELVGGEDLSPQHGGDLDEELKLHSPL
eukprot:CAMPEP_0174703000 /NCGR_PEP_ID=MMETSP1094-20130205/7107_1 /TAXON_ID=156173 /ORGANISM="Chrysochromulina brevifilum, Strain UTEX LB 985" /LENGTH=65 /DNA_ID=CAMNT_0015900861 /DNA_START=265 /DNA_END=462 /DNA_ORIENTATION=-